MTLGQSMDVGSPGGRRRRSARLRLEIALAVAAKLIVLTAIYFSFFAHAEPPSHAGVAAGPVFGATAPSATK